MKKVLGIILALIAVGAIVAYFIYNKPHRNISDTAPSYNLAADDLLQRYQEDGPQADSTFLNEVIVVSGTVLSKEEKAVLLDDAVYCKLDSLTSAADFSEGDEVRLKGRVLGYDDLFSQVQLDNCAPFEGE